MNRDERHAAWVKANWNRWTHTGSYCDGARVDMADVRTALDAYMQAVYGKPAAPEPCRAIVPYKSPVAVKSPLVTPSVIYLPAPFVATVWCEAMAA